MAHGSIERDEYATRRRRGAKPNKTPGRQSVTGRHMEQNHSQARTTSALIKRLVPLVVLLGGVATFFVVGLDQYISFDTLRDNRDTLLTLVEQYGLLASLAYMATYATVVAFSSPVAQC